MFPSLKTALVLALVAVAAPAAARAQSAQGPSIEQVRKNARVHAGPFYVTPLIQLKELGVDSNVFNASGDQKSDFMTNVSPRANIWIPAVRRALVTATIATDLVWYAKYDSERSVDPQVSLRGEAYLGRLTLFAQNDFLNTRQRPNYEIDLRSRHVENDILAGADLRLTPKFSIEAAARRFDTKYDAEANLQGIYLYRTLNRKTSGVVLTARHRLTPLTTVAARYENLRDRFSFSPGRDSDSYRIMPGVEFNARALIRGRAYAGYRSFTPRQADVLPAFSGLAADLGLSYTLLGATSFGVSFRRDLTYSYEETQPFFVDSSPGVSVRRALGRRFDVILAVDRHRYEYRDLLTAGAALEPRIDTTWNYSGSLGYRFGQGGRIGFGASYWTRDSTTVKFREYDNLRIGTTATYGF
jgi:hypothetical protein